MDQPKPRQIFVDRSALEALLDRGHPDHASAVTFLQTAQVRNIRLISCFNFLTEITDLICRQNGREMTFKVINGFRNSKIITFFSLNSDDEAEAWRLYSVVPEPLLQFSRCAAIALMNRLDISEIFGFETAYSGVGIRVVPEDSE